MPLRNVALAVFLLTGIIPVAHSNLFVDYDLDSIMNDTTGIADRRPLFDTEYEVIDEPTYVHYKGRDYHGAEADSMINIIELDRIREYEQRVAEQHRKDRINLLIVLGFLLLPLLIYGVLRIKYWKEDKLWEKGVYPEGYHFSRDHLLEAYIRLSVLMIFRDRRDVKEKIGYVTSFIYKHFPNNNVDLDHVMSHSIKHPIDVKTATAWLNRHLKKPAQRTRIIYFLTGISYIDGSITSKEIQLLRRINALLGLTPHDLKIVLNTYEKHSGRRRRQQQHASDAQTSMSRLEEAREVLNVSSSAGPDEIKKAYRSLAKKYHPDRMVNQSRAKQHEAEAKFILIQEAYELLMECFD